jgi:hypothetical protein
MTAHPATVSGRESSAYTALVLALVGVVIWLFDAVAVLVALVH